MDGMQKWVLSLELGSLPLNSLWVILFFISMNLVLQSILPIYYFKRPACNQFGIGKMPDKTHSAREKKMSEKRAFAYMSAGFNPKMAKYLCLLISLSLINFFNFALSVRVLFIGPYNQHIKSHFALAQTMSEVLAKHPFIEYLKIFMPISHKSPVPILKMSNKIEIETFQIGYKEIEALENYPKELASTEDGFELPPEKETGNWPTVSIELMNKFRFEMEMLLPEALSKHATVIHKLRAEKFDIGMTEYFFLGNLALFPLLDINNVVIHTAVPMFTPFFDLAGVIDEVKRLGVPERKAARVEGKKSYKKTRKEIASDFDVMTEISRKEIKNADQVFKKIYKDYYDQEYVGIPTLFQKTKWRFINWQPSIDFDQIKIVDKKIANLKYIGGIAVPQNFPEENEDTKAWFSDARFDSVVLLSFGSVFKTEYMPKSLYAKFMEAFKQFPKTLFIVKINSDSGEHDRPENVAFTKWMQQPLILAHPKTKVFITPCGSNSVVDSLAVGTPLLCIPVTTDQPYNSYLLVEKGMALTVSIQQIEKSETLHTNPLVIVLGKMMGWKDGNRHFKAKVAKVKEEMSRGEKNFVDSMGHLAAQIDDGKILEAAKKIGAK